MIFFALWLASRSSSSTMSTTTRSVPHVLGKKQWSSPEDEDDVMMIKDGGLEDVDLGDLSDVEDLISFEASVRRALKFVDGRLAVQAPSELYALAAVSAGATRLVVDRPIASTFGGDVRLVATSSPEEPRGRAALENMEYLVADDLEAANALLDDRPPLFTRVSASRARFLAAKAAAREGEGRRRCSSEVRLLATSSIADESLVERPIRRVGGLFVADADDAPRAEALAALYRSAHPKHRFDVFLPWRAYSTAAHPEASIFVLQRRDCLDLEALLDREAPPS